jgi:microsomal epoxide hydrolase
MLKLLFVLFTNMAVAVCALAGSQHHSFKASDGVRLNYMQAGNASRSIVFVPGWLMPAEIFKHQLTGLSDDYKIIVLDPRGQGRSQASKDMSAQRRAQDIQELVQHLKLKDYVLAGWSLGVMEVLEAVERHPLTGLKGLVLIDNSIGMGPSQPSVVNKRPTKQPDFIKYVARFSNAIFRYPPKDGLVEIVIQSASRLPPQTAWQLLAKPHDRSYYKMAVLSNSMPVWYAITPRYGQQGDELLANRAASTVTVFEEAGHALFVDKAQLFNDTLLEFMKSLPTP